MAIHLGHFDANRKRVLELVSKLERSKNLGTIKITLMVTGKAFPIIGRMKWKEKKFIDSLEMKVECPTCQIEGILQIGGSSAGIQHCKGFIGGRRIYEYLLC